MLIQRCDESKSVPDFVSLPAKIYLIAGPPLASIAFLQGAKLKCIVSGVFEALQISSNVVDPAMRRGEVEANFNLCSHSDQISRDKIRRNA